jgi:hypothetical protein
VSWARALAALALVPLASGCAAFTATTSDIADLSGTGPNKTNDMTMRGAWDVEYTYDCSSNPGGSGQFRVTVNNSEDNTFSDEAPINEQGKRLEKRKVAHYKEGGNHFLEIQTGQGCDWHITIRDVST